MFPPFDGNGFLPPGIHIGSLDDEDFTEWTDRIFADNRRHGKKGIVEVRL